MIGHIPDSSIDVNSLGDLKKYSKSQCACCRKKKLLVRDIVIDNVFYSICKACEMSASVPSIKQCLKCEKEFVSFEGHRLCSKCKGQSWDNRV